MKLGFVTYQIGAEWDVATLIRMCIATGFSGVELRTTHAHGVELELSAIARAELRKTFTDAGVEIAGLGSAFEFHDTDPAIVRRNIDGTIAYARLAADLGCPGIKVRPNGLQTEAGVAEGKNPGADRTGAAGVRAGGGGSWRRGQDRGARPRHATAEPHARHHRSCRP